MLVIIFLLFVVAPIGTFIHEAGHAIGAKLVKAEHIKLTIGLGKKIKTFHYKTFQLTLNMFLFTGGFIQSKRKQPYSPMDSFCITVLGPLHNFLYGVLFYLLSLLYTNQYINLLFLFNIWLALVNMIPFKIKGRASDGYTLLKIVLNNYRK